jgi:integrase
VSAHENIVESRTRGTWHLKYTGDDGKPHRKQIGTIHDLPTREDAEEAAKLMRRKLRKSEVPTIQILVERFREERMSTRFSTRRACDSRIENHILPRWGKEEITDVQPRKVELWLTSLTLSPKTRAHLRGLLRQLWDYAMYCGVIDVTRNPMELVTIRGVSKRTRRPRSLTVEEFQKFVPHLGEPFRTIALVCVCLGLRISETLGLRWSDVDWLTGKLRVERGIVRQVVGAVKTEYSERQLPVDPAMLMVLKAWKQTTQFSAQEDWLFASPVQLGRLPWSYPRVLQVFKKAGTDAGIGKVSPHALRHSYRSWLDAAGVKPAVQQKLMRHADIQTTMNTYGDVVTDEEVQANSRVVQMALSTQ